MAVAKFEFHDSLKDSVEYVTKDRGDEDVVSAVNCDLENAAEQFRNTKVLHDKMGDWQTLMLIQSFPPKERDTKTPQEFHELGKQLAQSLFPGYETVIRTHTDKGHIHNHICINTIHPETGVRICDEKLWRSVFGTPANKAALALPNVAAFASVYFDSKSQETGTKKWLHQLRSTNDRIAREAGLSVIEGKDHTRAAQLPKEVARMEQNKKDSWVLDLMQKANHARGWSTSYDEYTRSMKETFNIDVRVENKNIVYSYPGDQKRIKRGNKLGPNFDKAGLERNFEHNDRMFAARPELRGTRRAELDSLAAHPGRIVRDSSGVLLEPGGARTIFTKDYGAFTPTARPGRASRTPSDHELDNSLVPLDEVRRAKRSIPEYCKANNIALMKDDKGRTVLKGREHVVITDFGFLNTKSNTPGSLIDFVGIHQNVSHLRAISIINNNPRLLLLEQTFGERKRTFNSFYIPKPEQAGRDAAVTHVTKFFKTFGASPKAARSLVESGQAQVSKSGVIRLFGKEDGSAALEFAEDRNGAWNTKSIGKARRPLYAGKPNGTKIHVSLDPKSFIAHHGDKAFNHGKGPRGVLALLMPEADVVDAFISEHRQVSQVLLIFANAKPSKAELDFFGVLKNRYQHHGIEVGHAGMDKTLSREGPDLSF